MNFLLVGMRLFALTATSGLPSNGALHPANVAALGNMAAILERDRALHAGNYGMRGRLTYCFCFGHFRSPMLVK